jgi:lysophospholipase L1-like esterase
MARLGGFLAVLDTCSLGPAGASAGAGAPAALTLDYRLPPRYGLDTNRDGLVDSITTPAQVSPTAWTALVTVRWPTGGPCNGTYRWTIGGKPISPLQQRNPVTGMRTCTFAYSRFAELDHPYRVSVTATRQGSSAIGKTTVTIRDRLIVGLGDSTASGEGNPDHGVTSVRWQDPRSHRSAQGFEARVAARLEAASAKSSVTFVPLACSGASITTGMLGPYAGIAPTGGAPLPPQVDAMKELIGSRRVDSVLLSVGINDLGFGNVARFCFDDGVGAAGSRGRLLEQALSNCLLADHAPGVRALPRRSTPRSLRTARSRLPVGWDPGGQDLPDGVPERDQGRARRRLQPADHVSGQHGLRLHGPRHDHPRRSGAGRDRAPAAGQLRPEIGRGDVRVAHRLGDRIAVDHARRLLHEPVVRRRLSVADRAARRARTLHPNRQGHKAIAAVFDSALKLS